MLDDLTKHLMSRSNNKSHLMYELANCICAAIDGDYVNLYLHDEEGRITQFSPDDESKKYDRLV